VKYTEVPYRDYLSHGVHIREEQWQWRSPMASPGGEEDGREKKIKTHAMSCSHKVTKTAALTILPPR
jgi:hypothetical protein